MRFKEFQPVEEGVNDPHIFKAVFMAGSPGSGKTTIANKLFKGSGLRELNVDKFWQYYTAKQDPKDYEHYWEKYSKQNELFKQGRMGLLIDGTAKNPEKMQKVKEELESLGYETAMIFVNTSLETSLNRTVNRAKQPGPDYGREIDPEFVEDAWLKTQKGLGQLQSMFGQRFFIIDNNRGTPNISYVQKAIDKWLNAPPSSHIAKEWMKKEQQAKTQQYQQQSQLQQQAK